MNSHDYSSKISEKNLSGKIADRLSAGRPRLAILLHHRANNAVNNSGNTSSSSSSSNNNNNNIAAKSAPGSPSPSMVSYGSSSSNSDLISTASSALRRLHFKSSNAYRSRNKPSVPASSAAISGGNESNFNNASSTAAAVAARMLIGSNSVSTESNYTMNNTSTESGSTAFTLVTMTTDSGDADDMINPFVDDDKVRITPNLLSENNVLNGSSTEKEEEFFSACSSSNEENNAASRKSSDEQLRTILKQNSFVADAEDYDDPIQPLLQHTTVPNNRHNNDHFNNNNHRHNSSIDQSLEWYQIKIRQQQQQQQKRVSVVNDNQKKPLLPKKHLKLLSKKKYTTRCYFEEERVRNDLGRNSSGFAAEQMTLDDSEESFQWDSTSLVSSPPIPTSPTGSSTPTDNDQPSTVSGPLSPMKAKQHFTFPPLTEANDLLNELKVKIDRNRRQSKDAISSSDKQTRRENNDGNSFTSPQIEDHYTRMMVSKLKSNDDYHRRPSVTSVARTRSEEGRSTYYNEEYYDSNHHTQNNNNNNNNNCSSSGGGGGGSTTERRQQQTGIATTIVVQQASVTGNSPEQQQQQHESSIADGAMARHKSYPQQLRHNFGANDEQDDHRYIPHHHHHHGHHFHYDDYNKANVKAEQSHNVLMVDRSGSGNRSSATSSDESLKSDRTVIVQHRYRYKSACGICGPPTSLSNSYNNNNNNNNNNNCPTDGGTMKHRMLDVTNTATIIDHTDGSDIYRWNDIDHTKCSGSHHNRSQSVRTPGSKSNVQDRTANGTGNGRYRPNYLCLPQQRSRVASMPNTGVEEEYYRLRQFSITGKGIINRGDSLKSRRSRSNTSVASSNSSHSTEHVTTCGTTGAIIGGCGSHAGTASGAPSLPSSRESSCASCPGINPPYRVIMLGSSGVGKSSLVSQFMTSEYLQATGISIDEDFGEKSVCVSLDGEESEIMFIDQPSSKIMPEEHLSNYENPHGYCIVYSTSDRASFKYAEMFLQTLWKSDSIRSKAVILVGNKTDLVRSRVVTTEEGAKMATSYDSKFIETSVGINHNVDELLVGILTQIRLKLDNPPDPSLPRDQFSIRKRSRSPLTQCGPRLYRGSRTSASLRVRKILSKVWSLNSKSKSCENLHVL